MTFLIIFGSVLWPVILLLPWRPWSTRERLEKIDSWQGTDLSNVTVLVPARNEADSIVRTLEALQQQGDGLAVVLIDDQSSDRTVEVARESSQGNLRIVQGEELPAGWVGKLWALEQGRRLADTDLLLLLDADIELAPGTICAMIRKLCSNDCALVSLMAELRMRDLWESILSPAFIFFFKLLYPFALGNSPGSRLGVAAGGCVLVRADVLERIGGFSAFKESIIDDCTLAKKVKECGEKTWIGLSHSAKSQRAYPTLGAFWSMVTRTAFTQLRYSGFWLLVTTVLMATLFWCPMIGLASPSPMLKGISAIGLIAMWAAYTPTLRFYGRSPFLAVTLPFVATLYLIMTWDSAIRYWRGRRSAWKGRNYDR